MMSDMPFIHPYIPNSVPAVRKEMLEEIGLRDVEEILVEIPSPLRVPGLLDLPEPLLSEYELRRHVQGLLDRNISTAEHLSFLGGGCWPHFVPAVCDEIAARGEFLTAYSGSNYSDLGKYQARFEYSSLMAELLEYEVVVEPGYDWGTTAGFALRMAARLTGRREVLVPENMGPERRSIIGELCEPKYVAGHIAVTEVACDPTRRPIGPRRPGRPSCPPRLPRSTSRTPAISVSSSRALPKSAGWRGTPEPSLSPVWTPLAWAWSLRRAATGPISPSATCSHSAFTWQLAPASPASWPSAMRSPTWLNALSLSTRSSRRRCRESTPSLSCLSERTSYGARDKAPDWTGTQTGLWAICAGVYWPAWGRRACVRWERLSCGGLTTLRAA